MGYTDDMKKTQRITKDVVEYLRDWKNKKITTGTMAAITDKVREEYANKTAYLENKIVEHDMKIKEQESVISFFRRKLGVKRRT